MKKIATLFVGLSAFVLCAAQPNYTLEQMLDSARQNNLAMRDAQLDIDAARQQRKEAFTKYFPNISGTGLWFNADKGMAKMDINPGEMITPELGATLAAMFPVEALAALSNPTSITMMKNGTIAGVNATQPLFAGGQIVNGNRLAKVGEDVAKLQMQLTENEVELTTQQYFWQIISLQEKTKTIDAVEAMLNDIRKDVEVAVRAGLAVRNDLLQVQLRQNEIESQKLKLQNGLSLVKLLLAQYCGLHDSEFSLTSEIKDTGDLPMKEDHEQALLATAEYQLLGKQVEAAKLQREIAVGENLPSVAVGAGYNYHNLMENDRTFAMVYATVSVPISDWWGGSHAIKRKRIEYQKALDQQQDKSELLQIKMQNAWNNVVEARQQLDIAQRSIEQAEENLRLNRNFYKAGTIKMSDLLEAQLLFQQAQDQRTDAYADFQNKILEYKHAVGISE
jgi:outer membrane protein TolC